MKKQVQFKTRKCCLALLLGVFAVTTYGQGQDVGTQFTVNDFRYEITAVYRPHRPATVKVVDYTGATKEVTIPARVSEQGTEYLVTAIGYQAFSGHGKAEEDKLTSVDIPHTVTSIGNEAFRDNSLTEVVIPFRVNSIGDSAFEGNPLETVIIRSDDAPNLFSTNPFSNLDRSQIDLLVPADRGQHYLNRGWTNFESTNPATFTVVGITYAITSIAQGEVEIAGYDASAASSGTGVTIPQTATDKGIEYKVTAIGYQVFSGLNKAEEHKLTSVNFAPSSNVTSIKEDAFWQNKLNSVEIPTSVTTIRQRAFGTNQLTRVTIPDGITNIPKWAFADNRLAGLTIPANVESIGEQAFYRNQLEEVTFAGQSSVTSIGDRAFQSNKLTEVNIPGNVENIGEEAFYHNHSLKLVTVERDTPPALNGDIIQNPHGKDVIVPGGKVQVYLDNGWDGFKSIIGLFNDGDEFTNNDITYRVISTDPGKKTGEVAVKGYNGDAEVDIPAEVNFDNVAYKVTAIGNEALRNKQLTSVTIPETVTSIGASAFRNNELTSVTIPGNVTSIEQWAFADNPNLALVTLEATHPPSLHAEAFLGRDLGTIDVVVPWGKRQVYLDNGWTGFNNITEAAVNTGDTFTADHITYEVTSIAPNPNTFKAIGYNTAGGSTVTIPQTVNHDGSNYRVTAIGEEAFLNKQLTSVTIPGGVTSIGSHAFRRNQLTSLEIPGGVNHIGISAFMDNDINSVVIPTTVTSIGISAFWNNRIASLEIPGGIADIGENTFGRNNLASVTIPASVTSIGSNAFLTHPDEPGITQVTVLGNTPPTLAGSAFSNRNQIDVVVPKGKRQAYLDNGWTGFKSITEEKVVTAIRNYEFKDFTLYPNPARDKVYIDLRLGQKIKQVNIYTMTGAYLYSENGLEINTSRLSEGMYLFEIVTKTGARSMKKVIIQ